LRAAITGASQTKDLAATCGFVGDEIPIVREGTIDRISVEKAGAITAGSLTLTLIKNGSSTGESFLMTGSEDGKLWSVSSVTVDEGDKIGVRAETSSNFAMSVGTMYVSAIVEVEL
jgi:hypothetical protein